MKIILTNTNTNQSWFHNQIIEFAERFGLSTWDWIALIITSLSLFIAVISLIIATKTLRSQKATQKNTQPIMNVSTLEFLVEQKLLCVLDAYIFLLSLQYLLSKNNYSVKPSSHFWQFTNIPLKELDESLFYFDNSKYVAFHHLRTVLEDFNVNILGLKEILSSTIAKKEDKELELSNIYDSISLIMGTFYDSQKICFDKKDEDIETFINDYFINVKETRYNKIFREKYLSPQVELEQYPMFTSDSSLSQRPLYEGIAELAFQKFPMITKEKRNLFVTNLSNHVDAILMNTPCNGKIIFSIIDNTEESDNNRRAGYSYATYKSSYYDMFIPQRNKDPLRPYKLLKRWFYYVTSI